MQEDNDRRDLDRIDLHGEDLRGRDFSGRSLRRGNLSECEASAVPTAGIRRLSILQTWWYTFQLALAKENNRLKEALIEERYKEAHLERQHLAVGGERLWPAVLGTIDPLPCLPAPSAPVGEALSKKQIHAEVLRHLVDTADLSPNAQAEATEQWAHNLQQRLGQMAAADIVSHYQKEPTPSDTRKGTPVSRARFHVLIRHPAYMGIIQAFGGRYQGTFPALVSPEVFHKAQEYLTGKRRHIAPRYQKQHPDFPLRGSLVCAACSSKLTGSWSRGRGGRYAHYRCRSCRGRGTSINCDRLHRQFTAHLRSQTWPSELTDTFREVLVNAWRQRVGLRTDKQQDLGREIARMREDQKALILKDLRVAYSDRGIVSELLEEFDRRIAELTRQQQEFTALTDFESLLRYASSILQNLAAWWEAADLDLKVRFQKILFPCGIRVSRDGVFGTIPSLLLVELKKDSSGEESLVVDLAGVGPASKREQS